MSESQKNKYTKLGRGANKSVFKTISLNTDRDKKKKKATFDMDYDLHHKLRRYAVDNDTTMVTIVEKALNEFLKRN